MNSMKLSAFLRKYFSSISSKEYYLQLLIFEKARLFPRSDITSTKYLIAVTPMQHYHSLINFYVKPVSRRFSDYKSGLVEMAISSKEARRLYRKAPLQFTCFDVGEDDTICIPPLKERTSALESEWREDTEIEDPLELFITAIDKVPSEWQFVQLLLLRKYLTKLYDALTKSQSDNSTWEEMAELIASSSIRWMFFLLRKAISTMLINNRRYPRCRYQLKNHLQCKRSASFGSIYCHTHIDMGESPDAYIDKVGFWYCGAYKRRDSGICSLPTINRESPWCHRHVSMELLDTADIL